MTHVGMVTKPSDPQVSTTNIEPTSSLSATGSNIAPRPRLLVGQPRHPAVEQVGEPGGQEHKERPSMLAAQNKHDQERHHRHAQERELIGEGEDRLWHVQIVRGLRAQAS